MQTTKGKEYKFRVCAYNRMGKGPFLETKNTSLAKNPYDAPGAPGVAGFECSLFFIFVFQLGCSIVVLGKWNQENRF